MLGVIQSLGISLAFLVVNAIVLHGILKMNRPRGSGCENTTSPDSERLDPFLKGSDILGWEFEYARITASEAMRDRHTMVNYYLLAVGVVATGVVGSLAGGTRLPAFSGTLLLWLLCWVGWLYFLKIVRLRQAWHDSARTMNRIKDFYIQHVREVAPQVLRSAFRWQTHTLPAVDKPWTLYFYSTLLIGLLDSVAYVLGGALLGSDSAASSPVLFWGVLVLFGLAFLALHVRLYFAFLGPMRSGGASRESGTRGDGSRKDEKVAGPGAEDVRCRWVEVLQSVEDYAFGRSFRIVRATLRYRRLDGRMSEPVVCINFDRGESVGVLLHDPEADTVILVRQFRYPAYAALKDEQRLGEGAKQAWLLEIVAGVRDEGYSVEETVHRELLEEVGYTVKGDLQAIGTVYPSPGGTSERICLFLAEVGQAERINSGGGVAAEGEDIQVVVVPFSEAMSMISQGKICDAKTIIALQHLALHRAGHAIG